MNDHDEAMCPFRVGDAAKLVLPARDDPGCGHPRTGTTRRSARSAKGNIVVWFVLLIAGILEVVWAVGLKYTEGFTRLWPTVGTVAAMVASVGLLGLAMRTLPAGTAYAVWTGIGAVGTVIAGIVLFNEPASAARVACLTLIVAGIIGLKLTT
jgi:quaternary ammonium compound-resistance protein SugE